MTRLDWGGLPWGLSKVKPQEEGNGECFFWAGLWIHFGIVVNIVSGVGRREERV